MKLWKVAGVLISALALGVGCDDGSRDSSSLNAETEFLSKQGMSIGAGINTLSGAVLGDCVERTALQKPFEGATEAQVVSSKLVLVQSSHDVSKYLNVGVEGSVSGLWGNVSAKARMINGSHLEDYSINLLVYVNVLNQTQSMRDVELKPKYAELWKNDKERFLRTCGDSYIEGVATGGEYYALLTSRTHNEGEYSVKMATLEASGFGAKLEADLTTVDTQRLSTIDFTVLSEQAGGHKESANPVFTASEIIKRAQTFANIAATNPVPFSAIVKSYESIMPPEIDMYDFDIESLRESFAEMRIRQLDFQRLYSNLDFVINNQTEFKDADIAALKLDRQKFHDLSNDLESVIKSCSKTFKCELNKSKFAVPLYELPKYTPTKKLIAWNCGGAANVGLPVSHTPPLINGDSEFGGKVAINIGGEISHTADSVSFKIDVDMQEPGDSSHAKGSKIYNLYTAPDGWLIERIDGKTYWPNIVNYVDNNWETQTFTGDHVPGVFHVFGDHNGNDAGVFSRYEGELKCSIGINLTRKLQ